MKIFNLFSFFSITSILILTFSCKKIEVEYDCGTVDTAITELTQRVGTYTSASFENISSSNFEEAAIAIYVENFTITSDTENSCFAFTPVPQLVEKIRITSSNSVTSGGVEFASGEDLKGLFKLYNDEESYSISEFITAQNIEPLKFHTEGDVVVLQLLSKPDTEISQSFEVELTFDDSEILTVQIPAFEVAN